MKDLHQESHEKSSNSLAWTSMQGKGNTGETLKQSQLVAQGQLAIQAANKIHIDVKDINGQTVSQTVEAMVKADPNLAWIKQAEERGDVDWRQVKEIHDSLAMGSDFRNGAIAAGANEALMQTLNELPLLNGSNPPGTSATGQHRLQTGRPARSGQRGWRLRDWL